MRALFVLFAVCSLATPALPLTAPADTIGGTVYDMSTICAGLQRMVYYAPGQGVHATWVWADSYPAMERNCRYNFRGDSSGAWSWIGPDFMSSGMNAYPGWCSFGGVDYDIGRMVPVISYSIGSMPVRPAVARGIPGQPGQFEYSEGPGEYRWPWCAVTASGTIHVAATDDATRDGVWYTRTTDFQNWSVPVHLSDPDPTFPCQVAVASKQTNRLAVLWVHAETWPCDLYYRASTDDGQTWGNPVLVPPPPAYGGDTVAGFYIASTGALYDRGDSLCIIASVNPMLGDSSYYGPCDIWFHNPARSPAWSRVHRVEVNATSVRHGLGYNSTFACRPKVGQNPETGEWLAVWCQLDTANFEPVTDVYRADLWLAASQDDGRTWTEARRLTGPDTRSRMYADLAPVVNDTLHLVWIEDLLAGWGWMGQGECTDNPVVYVKLPAHELAIEEGPKPQAPCPKPGATVVRGVLWRGAGTVPQSGASGALGLSRAVLLDAAGRR